MVRPGRKAEIEITLADRQEAKDALKVSFTFGAEQHLWSNLITRLKEFITAYKIDWLTFEEHSWGESWTIHGDVLTSYFTEISGLSWLNREFTPVPAWRAGPRPGTGDPADSSSIEFTLLEP